MAGSDVLAQRYRLGSVLGRGGMGEVWSARDEVLGRDVAIKIVHLDDTTDPIIAERFRQEAKATAALNHPNIVTIYDSGIDGDRAFLVMELLTGESLERLVTTDGPLPLDRALMYGEQVASALAAAHRAGIVHRDIKPSNLMLDARGQLKIVDFGIARLDQERASRLTATATVIGSAPYLSPEQATGSVAGPQSDLYSLGCVLMTLITGAPPFDGEHPLAILHSHLATAPPPLASRRPGVPEVVERLEAQLLAKRPEDRPASAEAVAEQLRAIRAGDVDRTVLLPAAGPAATRVTPVAPTPAPVPMEPVVARPIEPERRSGGGAGWFVALLLALVLVAAVWWALNNGLGSRPSTTPTTSSVTSLQTTTESSTAPSTSEESTSEPSSTQPSSTSTSATSEPTSTQPTSTEPSTTESSAATSTSSSASATTPAWTTDSTRALAAVATSVISAGLPADQLALVQTRMTAVKDAIDAEDQSATQAAVTDLRNELQGSAVATSGAAVTDSLNQALDGLTAAVG